MGAIHNSPSLKIGKVLNNLDLPGLPLSYVNKALFQLPGRLSGFL
jgi:hypothetical protein